jgi:excisionase family DNA binding protein
VGEDRTDAHSVGRGKDRLTIAEAATLLGVHKNTVRNRIKKGPYRAELVQTERGPTYLIERDSLLTNLTTNTLSSASQDVVSLQAMEFVQELLRPFVSELGEVREELGAERARRQVAEGRAAALEAELEALRDERESPETVEEAPDRAEAQEELGAERARREMAETTLHEGMAEERRRREEAERERDELRRELYARREPREAPETVEDSPERAEPQSATGGAQEAVRRPWWRRLFGG